MAKLSRRVGLEVSNSAVRMAELAPGGSRPKILKLAQVRLPVGAVVDGTITDVAAVATAIRRCMKEGGFGAVDGVRLGVAGLRAITRELDMPVVPDGELDAAVRLQALDVIPFPEDRTILAARPLGEISSGADEAPTRRVMVAAAHRDLVDPLLDATREAGLSPLSIDLGSTALVRSLYDPSNPAGGPEAIVSIGSGLTTIVVHEAGVPHFLRTIAEGGDTVTAAIAGALDIPPDDAEVAKRNLDDSAPHIRAAAAAAEAAALLLITEIRGSVQYYETLPGRSEVARVILTGGGSKLPGLVDHLRQQLRAEVVVGRTFSRVDASPLKLEAEDLEGRDALAATVVGLALLDPAGTKSLDLLPLEILAARRLDRQQHKVFVVAAAIVVLLVAAGGLRYFQVHNADSKLASLKETEASLAARVAREDKEAQTYNAILSDRGEVSPLLDNEVDWPKVYADLDAETPKGGSVTAVSGTLVSSTSTTSVPSSSATAQNPLPADETPIASLNVTISSGDGLAYFKTWLEAMTTSKQFHETTFSGISSPSGDNITWSATLEVYATIQSGRLAQFESSGQ